MDVVVVVTEYDEDEGTVVDIGDETDDDNSAGCWCWGREREERISATRCRFEGVVDSDDTWDKSGEGLRFRF